MRKLAKQSLRPLLWRLVSPLLRWRTTMIREGGKAAASPPWTACISSQRLATLSPVPGPRSRKPLSNGYALTATIHCPWPVLLEA